jgi:hypothetical protein
MRTHQKINKTTRPSLIQIPHASPHLVVFFMSDNNKSRSHWKAKPLRSEVIKEELQNLLQSSHNSASKAAIQAVVVTQDADHDNSSSQPLSTTIAPPTASLPILPSTEPSTLSRCGANFPATNTRVQSVKNITVTKSNIITSLRDNMAVPNPRWTSTSVIRDAQNLFAFKWTAKSSSDGRRSSGSLDSIPTNTAAIELSADAMMPQVCQDVVVEDQTSV